VPFPQLFAKGKSLKSEGIGMPRTKISVYMAYWAAIGPCRTNIKPIEVLNQSGAWEAEMSKVHSISTWWLHVYVATIFNMFNVHYKPRPKSCYDCMDCMPFSFSVGRPHQQIPDTTLHSTVDSNQTSMRRTWVLTISMIQL
jgi:hypothetical protein